MRITQRVGNKLTQKTAQTVDPRVVLGSRILQLTQPELQNAIETELNENPALERIDDFDEPLTEEEILSTVAPKELRHRERDNDYEMARTKPLDEQPPDWVDLAPSGNSLWDHLHAQLLFPAGSVQDRLAKFLIGSINETGYLETSEEEAALACDCSLEDATAMIDRLQACEPAGIGARDLRESLVLQLRSAESVEQKAALYLLQNHWELVVKREYRMLARKLKVDVPDIERAFAEIRMLSPSPSSLFSTHLPQLRHRTAAPMPEIVISRRESGWLVEIPGAEHLNLRISSSYETRIKQLKRLTRPDRDEKRHLLECVDRANRFLEAIAQRRRLLQSLGALLIDRQNGFLATGEYQFLKPLTRSQLAEELNVHESTVSRATNGKFIQVPSGEIISFEIFFKPALRVQKMIDEILSLEDPNFPLSDERISRMLAERGVKVARRTVNKYRDRSKNLSSRKRSA